MPGASLYIHVPFCRAKCIYCDFYSITQLTLMPRYINALHQEIASITIPETIASNTVTTIYFGGGTPSLMQPDFYSSTLEKLQQRFNISPDAEISFEANPGTLLNSRLDEFLDAGLDRITLGVQSLDNDELRTLSRIHTAEQAVQALEKARNAGYCNIGLDLIFGIPGQSAESFRRSLNKAIAMRPEHISMYGLTIEHGTPLDAAIKSHTLHACDEEVERRMYLLGMELLTAAGYEQYEISNFCLPGYVSKHNSKYWDGSPYLGLGPSAHSFDGVHRWWNIANMNTYIANMDNGKAVIDSRETLSLKQKLEEMILLGFRRREGVSLAAWHEQSGQSLLQQAGAIIQELGGTDDHCHPLQLSCSGQYLVNPGDTLALTRQGLLLYDTICERFFSII